MLPLSLKWGHLPPESDVNPRGTEFPPSDGDQVVSCFRQRPRIAVPSRLLEAANSRWAVALEAWDVQTPCLLASGSSQATGTLLSLDSGGREWLHSTAGKTTAPGDSQALELQVLYCQSSPGPGGGALQRNWQWLLEDGASRGRVLRF